MNDGSTRRQLLIGGAAMLTGIGALAATTPAAEPEVTARKT